MANNAENLEFEYLIDTSQDNSFSFDWSNDRVNSRYNFRNSSGNEINIDDIVHNALLESMDLIMDDVLFSSIINGMNKELDIQPVKYGDLSQKNNTECSICLIEYENEDHVIETKCDHVFHMDCLTEWLTRKMECPLCRSEI